MRAPITMKGAQRLRDELDHLKSVKRPKVIAAIAEAREHGDLKENAEYHAAREEQGFIEGRIKQLEGELSHAEIIDVSKLNAGSKVVFGASVILADVESDEEKKYQIVGDLEADIKLGLIAISSPVARAMIAVESPNGRAMLPYGGRAARSLSSTSITRDTIERAERPNTPMSLISDVTSW